MRKKLFIPIAVILFSLACSMSDLSLPEPVATPYILPTFTPTPTEMPTPTATSLPPTREVEPVPSWIARFSDPLLAAVANHPPFFKDDFSGYNLGWFYWNRDSQDGPFYVPIQNETISLKMPNGGEYRDSMIYNSHLIRRNFVLSLDFKFGKTQPRDVFRIQFNQSADRSMSLDLSKHEDWSIDWSLRNSRQASAGTYENFPPELLNVTIIMRGSACAVYLNHDPLGYLEQCRPGSMVEASPQAVSLHLLSTTGQAAQITLDNVKLWDLDEIPDLP